MVGVVEVGNGVVDLGVAMLEFLCFIYFPKKTNKFLISFNYLIFMLNYVI